VTAGRRIEIGLLIALCVFLPLYEAPKNLAWLGYVLAWLINRVRARDFGGPWDRWDSLICAWIGSGFLVAAFAGLRGSEWHAALDIVRYGGVLWLLKRTRFTEREVRLVLGALLASVVAGLVHGFVKLSAGADQLELNSVGHVNHSTLYVAIMLGVAASWLFTGRARLLNGALVVFLIASLFMAASRAGVILGLLALLVLGACWWPRSRAPLAIAAGVIVLSVAAAAAGWLVVYERHQARVEAGKSLSYRDQGWRLALAAWREYPLFGVGMDNFGRYARRDAKYAAFFPHPHNLYLGALAERGLVGAGVLALVLAAWLAALIRRRARPPDSDHDWLLWGSAAGAWIVTAIGGVVNTTLHHEHGLLAVLLLGLWLGRVHRR
jgi:O-antigen ligase